MLFKDMLPHKRQQWLAWADSHDWGQNRDAAFMADGTMRVESAIMSASGDWDIETYFAVSPSDLRGWAGY